MTNKINKNERGFALPLALLLLVVMTIMGLTLVTITSKEHSANTDKDNKRILLSLKPHLSPIKAAIIPLKKNNDELVNLSKEIKSNLQKLGLGRVVLENSGNIGKNYRRHDEIGIPICITVDFETLEDKSVTVRDRVTMEQKRINLDGLENYYRDYFN